MRRVAGGICPGESVLGRTDRYLSRPACVLIMPPMKTTDGADLQLRYQLRPTERVIYTFLFQPFGRIFLVVGVAALIAGLLVGGTLGAALIGGGAMAATFFAWSPFVARRQAPVTDVVLSGDSLTYEAAGTRGVWSAGAVRRVRRVAGALAIDFEPSGTIPIPMRVLDTAAMAGFEALATPDSTASVGISDAVSNEVVGTVAISATVHATMIDGIRMLAHRRATLVGMVAGLVLLILTVGDQIVNGAQRMEPPTALLLAGIGIILVTTPVWAFPVGLRLAGGRAYLLGPMPVDIGDRGYRARAPSGDVAMPWTSFRSARRTGAFVTFVMRSNGASMLFPARGLDADQAAQFDVILRTAGLSPGSTASEALASKPDA